MGANWRSLLVAVALVVAGGGAWAQEHRPGWLGVELQDVAKEEADKLGWEAPRGAKVMRVVPGAPAKAAGIEPRDVITTLDGIDVEGSLGLTRILAAREAGATVRLRLLRNGRERTVSATLGIRQGAAAYSAPQLVLDTGGHTSTIRGLAFTPDGRQLVSGSQDKTIRVWDADTGKSVRIIRGEVAPGSWGAIYNIALSPDGRWLAVGGFLGDERDPAAVSVVRLYDFASSELQALLKGHVDVVWTLAFSPDSKRLVSGSFDKTAIVWDLPTRQQVFRLAEHAGSVKAVAFTSDGRQIVTGSEDGLRLWSAADGMLVRDSMVGWRGGVESLAASPNTPLVASGGTDGRILLWDVRARKLVREVGSQRLSEITSLSFSPDGHRLLSSSHSAGCALVKVALDGWAGEMWGSRSIELRCNGDSAHGPRGQVAIRFNSAIHLLEAGTGAAIRSLEGSGATVHAVAFADDSRSIMWGNTIGLPRTPLARRLRLPLDGKPLGVIEAADGGKVVSLGSATHGPLSARLKPGPGGAPMPDYVVISEGGTTRAEIHLGSANQWYASPIEFGHHNQTILIGTSADILQYDLDGHPVGEFIGHFGQVRDLALSPDGRFLVSGSADQTVRLWNLKTRELIVSLFHGSDGEWVMWTPQGYYTGSPGADKIVGWQFNNGPGQTPGYVGADQLRQHLNRPDIVEKAIILASAEEAVHQAPGTSLKLADLLAQPVPRFRIITPATGSTQRGGRASVKLAIDATPDPVRLIRVQVNGRHVEEQTPEVGSGGFGAGERMLDLPLAGGRNEIRIALTNAVGEKAETLVLTHEGGGDLDKRGTLHILAIGVNEYKGLGTLCGAAGCDLRYSVADARKLAEAVERRLGPGHSRVVKRVLVNGGAAWDAPTTSNIMDAVEMLRQAKETDTVVLFIAGHGVNDGPDYRFLATDAELANGGSLRGSTVVPWQVLQSAMEAANGRRILFVDTCHSGNAYNQRLGNAAYHANIIAYTAARFDQEALEDASLGHGIFTHAVIEGLDGKGELAGKRRISTRGLAGYVVRWVGDLAKRLNGAQEPQYFKGRDADDYVLAQW